MRTFLRKQDWQIKGFYTGFGPLVTKENFNFLTLPAQVFFDSRTTCRWKAQNSRKRIGSNNRRANEICESHKKFQNCDYVFFKQILIKMSEITTLKKLLRIIWKKINMEDSQKSLGKVNLRKKNLLISLPKIRKRGGRAWPDWAYEFPDWTGPDTQICWTCPAGPDWIRTCILNILHTKYGFSILLR